MLPCAEHVEGSNVGRMIDLDDAASAELNHVPASAEQVVEGSPTVGYLLLGEFSGHEYGIWEMSPGAMWDVEEDELFVVLSGHGVVEHTEDDTKTVLGPGVVVRLTAGAHTTWTITETLRKVWMTPL